MIRSRQCQQIDTALYGLCNHVDNDRCVALLDRSAGVILTPITNSRCEGRPLWACSTAKKGSFWAWRTKLHRLGDRPADYGRGGLCGFSHLPDRADDERQRNRRRVSQLTDKQANAKFLAPVDVSKDADIAAFMDTAAKEFGKIDFLLHSIAFANTDDLAKPTIDTSREGFKLAIDISAYSLLRCVMPRSRYSIPARRCSP